ncbi:MAG: transposase [Kiloniellales bacterium]|nr:transposase [Kiloniellales bacterium]
MSSRSAKRFRQIVPARTSRCSSIVRGSVEDTLDALLEAEADRLVGAARYERTEARRDTRAGSYERKLQRTTGEVKLKVPQH